jgi:hypothetical protein
MTDDEIGLETEIAEQLDDIAAELNGIAEQLRRKPFAAVERQFDSQLNRLKLVRQAGRLLKDGGPRLAENLLRHLGNVRPKSSEG